jgi:DNA-binding transcriptional ArsR family regulator
MSSSTPVQPSSPPAADVVRTVPSKVLTLDFAQATPVIKILQSKTAQKILDHLASKSLTMTELSQLTQTPLPTIQYNIEQLLQAKLIQCDAFHYSAKGKKVSHFSLTHQYIVIAPKQQTFAQELSWIVPSLLAGAVVYWNSALLLAPSSEQFIQPLAKSAQPASDVLAESAPMALQAVDSALQVSTTTQGLSPMWLSLVLICVVAISFLVTRSLVHFFSRKK